MLIESATAGFDEPCETAWLSVGAKRWRLRAIALVSDTTTPRTRGLINASTGCPFTRMLTRPMSPDARLGL